MTGNDAGELLPCPNPWCASHTEGAAPNRDDVWQHPALSPLYRVQCCACPIKGPAADTEQKAIAAWNTRTTPASAGVLVEALRRLEQANDAVAAATTRERYLTDLADVQPALLELDDARAIARQALSASTATAASDGETLGPLWRKVQQVHTDAMSHDWSVDSYRSGMAATLGLSNTPTPDRFGEGYRAGVEASGEWQDIASAPKDRTEFLSYGGTQGRAGSVYPTKWLSPGPYSTENGKNTPGERRFQYPEGFYWAGYDGFVGPVDPTHWRPLPAAPSISALHPATGDEA